MYCTKLETVSGARDSSSWIVKLPRFVSTRTRDGGGSTGFSAAAAAAALSAGLVSAGLPASAKLAVSNAKTAIRGRMSVRDMGEPRVQVDGALYSPP